MKRLSLVLPATLVAVAACSDAPTGVAPNLAVGDEMVITTGVAAPAPTPRSQRPMLSLVATATANLGGSTSTPVTLTPQTCASTASQQVVITYSITGRQDNPASFKVNTSWSYNGTSWSGSTPTTVSVPARAAQDPATSRQVTITVTNASGTSAGTSALSIPAFDLVTSAPAALAIGAASGVTVNVAFGPCAVTNTPPSIVIPSDMTVEATSSAGAAVSFVVTASDAQDGDLTGSVVCTPASGSIFALGETTVNCSVSDTGGLSASGSFTVKVVDTTPAFFTSFPTGTIELTAASLGGATLDVSSLGIAAADVNGVSEPATWSCDYVAGTLLAIGSTTTVSCTAKDAIGNESAPSTFDVFVGLDVNATGFLSPLRMAAPYSAHKRGSTIPHKFLPPTYADGTPAIDLASGLRLVVQRISGDAPGDVIDVNDFSAGSTEWRYDPTSGQYVFNLKTQTSWEPGTWKTTVSYAGIPLASTQFELRR